MKYVAITILLFISLSAFAQRDTLVTKKLMFINKEINTELSDNQMEWSDDFTDYIEYSRIDMGRRMNLSIASNKLATKQFYASAALGVGSGVFLVRAAFGDPVMYVEKHSKYTKQYYNHALNDRKVNFIMAGALGAGAIYMLFRSTKNHKKSRWYISPNGVRFKFW